MIAPAMHYRKRNITTNQQLEGTSHKQGHIDTDNKYIWLHRKAQESKTLFWCEGAVEFRNFAKAMIDPNSMKVKKNCCSVEMIQYHNPISPLIHEIQPQANFTNYIFPARFFLCSFSKEKQVVHFKATQYHSRSMSVCKTTPGCTPLRHNYYI